MQTPPEYAIFIHDQSSGEVIHLRRAKITIFAGHYGSGKTTVAVNYAMALAKTEEKVALCDMDIVNPYFRTTDFAGALEEAGVALISSAYANKNVEMAWIPVEALRIFDDPALTSVIDLGGDDRGALAIGQYVERLENREDVALWMVVNPYRPLTRDVAGLRAIRQEIEAAARLRFTGLVNNANLGPETTADTITATFPLMRELSEALDLPIIMTTVKRGIVLNLPEGQGERFEIECYGNRFGV